MDVYTGHISAKDAGPVLGSVYINKLIERWVQPIISLYAIQLLPQVSRMLLVTLNHCTLNSDMILPSWSQWLL